MYSAWDQTLMKVIQPSIQYLELFAVTAAVLTWVHPFKNQKIRLFCDNKSVVGMINQSSSSCKNCMVLIRLITLKSLQHNVRVFAKHVKTSKNPVADALSRLRLHSFRRLAPHMKKGPTKIPSEIWLVSKIWSY